MMNTHIYVENNKAIEIKKIPTLNYDEFYNIAVELLPKEEVHCVNYFGFPYGEKLKFICAFADDKEHKIALLSYEFENKNVKDLNLKSLTETFPAMHIFEREINENFGIMFQGHPWLKPIRFPHNRYDKKLQISQYPFYQIESEQLHEVGVGPIHAGVIEPGHFRFICNGENVLSLEIQLGWQHRGIENLFLKNENWLGRNLLAENIAGDTAIGHASTFASAIESLAGIKISKRLKIERMIALELERIATNTGDMSALCTDIAYQLGAAVFGILRTPIVNFTQRWCGNRLGKGMIRIGGTHYPLTPELRRELHEVLKKYKKKFLEMAHQCYHLVSLQDRFDDIGTLTKKQVRLIGAVGMAARMAGLPRDIRKSHPSGGYEFVNYEPITLESGDVFARFLLRSKEIQESLKLIENIISNDSVFAETDDMFEVDKPLTIQKDSFVLSLTEGWRGEICHTAITDNKGDLLFYKIKDPSLHNWKALELSLRNLEISDFPINNKSYNLSYAGNDL
ncbi:NADH dehydrogenase subunit [bacterium]|nr:NADH dehydrogenase subunit [bacterium]